MQERNPRIVVESVLIVEADLESGADQQPACLDRELKMPGRRVLEAIERQRKTAEVVKRCGRFVRRDLEHLGLPVRRDHQHRVHAGQFLAQRGQRGAELPGFQREGRRTVGNEDDGDFGHGWVQGVRRSAPRPA